MQEAIRETIKHLVEEVRKTQKGDGSFHFCFENSLLTDAYMIILFKSLGVKEQGTIDALAERLQRLQHPDGYWKLFEDETDGNLSATIEAYYALLYSGNNNYKDANMKAARNYIVKKGGIENANSLTKIMLAVTGQYKWPNLFHIPIHFVLLPSYVPISFFDFSGYARVHMAPILLLSDSQYSLTRKNTPNLDDLHSRHSSPGLHSEETRATLSTIKQPIKSLIGLPYELHHQARKQMELYMLQRIEKDGTLYSYFSSTFLMIYALLSLGYSKQHPILIKALNGLKTLACHTSNGLHIQNSTSTVWDTTLLSYVLQMTDSPSASSMAEKAQSYILSRQHYHYGDWIINNKNTQPGGWGFSNINTLNPDVDDTTAALRALRKKIPHSPELKSYWNHGLNWLLSMQNDDGGWPAFEKNKDNRLLTHVPIDGAGSSSIDPSTVDLTGRTLEFLGADAKFSLSHPQVKRAVKWLEHHQNQEGSWYGRWGITYIYGTWAAVTGMMAVGKTSESPSIEKAIHWLESIQNEDGGWGESCYSDSKKTYVPLHASTISHTSWALDTLISVYKKDTPVIHNGIKCLLRKWKDQDWTFSYPTGAGLPGQFYIYYHSYNYIWPLLVLNKYLALQNAEKR